MVVGLVNLYVAHQLVERCAHHHLLLRVGKAGDGEPHGVNLGQVKPESIVEESGIGDIHLEAAHIDVAGKDDVAVALDDNVAFIGLDDHQLAVAHHELLDAVHTQVEGCQIQLSIVGLGVRLQGEGVVVVSFLLDNGLVEAYQLIVDMDAVAAFVKRDKAVAREAVNHQLGLSFVHADIVLERHQGKVRLHVVCLHIAIDTHHRAGLVDALHLAILVFGIVSVRLKSHKGLGVALRQHIELHNVLVDKPVDVLAVDVQLVIAVGIGAIVIALGIIEQIHAVVLGGVADKHTGIADRVVAYEHFDCGALGGEHVGQDGELGAVGHQEAFPVAVEHHRGGMLLVVGHKAGAVHHEVTLEIHARQHILQLKVLLIGAELGEIVFVRLCLGIQRLLHHTFDGGLEIVGVDKGHRVGGELGELHHCRIVLEVGIAGVLGHTAAFPCQAAALALEGVGQEIVDARGAVDG